MTKFIKLIVDEKTYVISELTLKRFPDTELYKVFIEKKDHNLFEVFGRSIYIDLHPFVVEVIVNYMRGYPNDFKGIKPKILRSLKTHLSELGYVDLEKTIFISEPTSKETLHMYLHLLMPMLKQVMPIISKFTGEFVSVNMLDDAQKVIEQIMRENIGEIDEVLREINDEIPFIKSPFIKMLTKILSRCMNKVNEQFCESEKHFVSSEDEDDDSMPPLENDIGEDSYSEEEEEEEDDNDNVMSLNDMLPGMINSILNSAKIDGKTISLFSNKETEKLILGDDDNDDNDDNDDINDANDQVMKLMQEIERMRSINPKMFDMEDEGRGEYQSNQNNNINEHSLPPDDSETSSDDSDVDEENIKKLQNELELESCSDDE